LITFFLKVSDNVRTVIGVPKAYQVDCERRDTDVGLDPSQILPALYVLAQQIVED